MISVNILKLYSFFFITLIISVTRNKLIYINKLNSQVIIKEILKLINKNNELIEKSIIIFNKITNITITT
jgi:hypothetical protein